MEIVELNMEPVEGAKKRTIDDFTSECPICVSPEDSIDKVANLMNANGIRHIPVLEKDRPIGIICSRELRIYLNFADNQKYLASDIMEEKPLCVPRGSCMDKVAYLMSNKKYGSVLVVNPDGTLHGIFTSTDALNALVEIVRGDA